MKTNDLNQRFQQLNFDKKLSTTETSRQASIWIRPLASGPHFGIISFKEVPIPKNISCCSAGGPGTQPNMTIYNFIFFPFIKATLFF
jgi:hypothetical protein